MGTRIAFLGMGGMAKAMTRNLVQYGGLQEPLILYNRTRSVAEEHSQSIGHSIVAASIDEAIEDADIVWSCLQDDVAVKTTIEECLKVPIHGKLFVDSSSIPPEETKLIAQKVIDSGGEFVSMPVMGEPSMAEKRLIHCIVAGNRRSIERIKPYTIGVVSQSLIDLDDQPPEHASLLKLIGNVFILLTMETVAEVNVFAEKAGVGTTSIQKLFSALLPRSPHLIYNDRMASGGYYLHEPTVMVHKARKLATHVKQLADTSGVSIPAYDLVMDHLKDAEAHGGPSADITGIYGAVRVRNGLAYQNKAIEQTEAL